MIAEQLHIYTPDEIDQIEPLSELELCAEYIFKHIKALAERSNNNQVKGLHYPIYISERFNLNDVSRVTQLLVNAGWDMIMYKHTLYIHKRHFE